MPWAQESTFLYQYIKVRQPTKNKKEFQSPYQETNKLQSPQRATHKSAYPILHRKLKNQIDNMLIYM